MRKKIEKILIIITVITVFLSSFPLRPIKAAADAIAVVGNGLQIVADALGILTSVNIFSAPCACPNAILGCASPTVGPLAKCPSIYDIWGSGARHADIANILTAAEAQMFNSLVDQAEKVIAAAKTVDFLDIAEGIVRKQGPLPPPPNPPPSWWPGVVGGAIASIPFLAFRTTGDELEEILKDYVKVVEKTMKEKGYYFCFINQEFLPLELEVPMKDNYLLGMCELTGLAVYDINDFETFIVWNIAQKGSELEISIHQNVKTSFVDNRGQEHTFSQNGSILTYRIDGRDMVGTSVNGEMIGFIRTLCGRIWKVVESVNISDGSTYLIPIETEINGNIISQTPNVPAPNVNLAPVNALNNLDELMELIRQIAYHPDLENDEVVITLPILQPEFFPDIPPEHFHEFAQEFLNNLTIEHIVMPGHEAITIINNVPEITIPTPQGTDLEEVTGLLRRILRVLEDLLRAIINLPPNIATSIRDSIQGDDYPPEIYIPEGEDFDFKLNLMDYFPFSIPRDFVDIVSILLGGIPVEMAGATAYERMIFSHYQDVGYITPEGFAVLEPLFANSFENKGTDILFANGYAAIEPLFVSNLTTTPRFEFHIPFPNFINAVGVPFEYAFINMTEIHVATLDFDDYPTLVAVIRMGVFVLFLIAMINATTRMITW